MKREWQRTQVDYPSARLWRAQPRMKTRPELLAFTLVECLAVVAALGLLACVALPVLAGTRSDQQRTLCVNNLRQIGQAWGGWKNEHGDRTPAWVPQADGGMSGHPLRQNPWAHYSLLSNHLATPRILACPADPIVKPASTWSNEPGRGFVGPGGLFDNALSFTVGLHALPEYSTELLGSDHYWARQPNITGCTTGVEAATLITNDWTLGWRSDAGHDGLGNLLLNDGQVRTTTSDGLRAYMDRAEKYNSAYQHILQPNRPSL